LELMSGPKSGRRRDPAERATEVALGLSEAMDAVAALAAPRFRAAVPELARSSPQLLDAVLALDFEGVVALDLPEMIEGVRALRMILPAAVDPDAIPREVEAAARRMLEGLFGRPHLGWDEWRGP
jgi:hypothetical protein